MMVVSVGYFIAAPTVQDATSTIEGWAVILGAFALGLGAINILIFHSKIIYKRTKGQWYYSVLLVGTMLLMIAVGLAGPIGDPAFVWMYSNFYTPLAATMSSLLGFFFCSAVYRGFKARNVGAILFLLAAFFVILKNAPLGGAIWPGFESLGSWILDYPGNAGMRGFIIAFGIGVIAFGIRNVLGYERGWLGRER
jgi:hypothetical protein